MNSVMHLLLESISCVITYERKKKKLNKSWGTPQLYFLIKSPKRYVLRILDGPSWNYPNRSQHFLYQPESMGTTHSEPCSTSEKPSRLSGFQCGELPLFLTSP